MSIQSSINQTLASVAGLMGLGKFVKGQERIAAGQEKITSSFDKLVAESKPLYESHQEGYEQGLEDIQELYDPQTGQINQAVVEDVLTNKAYEGSTARATAEMIQKSHENISSKQMLQNLRKMAVKDRADFLKQAQHIQAQEKRGNK